MDRKEGLKGGGAQSVSGQMLGSHASNNSRSISVYKKQHQENPSKTNFVVGRLFQSMNHVLKKKQGPSRSRLLV